MIKLNDNDIFVTEIKQILKEFNLPQCYIGDDNPLENNHYIKDYGIYLYKNSESKRVSVYNYGEKYLNLTSNLKIDNLVYDRVTHRYLGRYLRFLRDYKGIDLMSMYNCFDGDAFDTTFEIKGISFGSDTNNITYKIPITNKPLNIKLFGGSLVNICVYIDSNETFTKTITEGGDEVEVKVPYKQVIAEKTFLNKKSDQLFIYDSLSNPSTEFTEAEETFIKKNYNRMFLLLNINGVEDNSIVILESNNIIDNKIAFYNNKDYNNFAIFPQLLSLDNAKGNYLLGDRLIEYLTHNAICPLSNLADINRIHDVFLSNPHVFPFKEIATSEESSITRKYGVWNKVDSKNIKYFIKNNMDRISDIYDLLGYVDKDVEQLIKEKIDNASTSQFTDTGNNYVQ